MQALRKMGIDIIGEVQWPAHFCQFYKTREDLRDILVPYFKSGLEGNEYCIWITAEPLNDSEAKKAMQKAMPDFQDYLDKGQIEILTYRDWYLKKGTFDMQRVLNGWTEKLDMALKKGYAGLRLSGNTFWLEKRDWKSFMDYEAMINNVIENKKMIALCTYNIDKCSAAEIIDVIRNHEFALIKQDGKWELIENAGTKRTKEALEVSEERFRSIFENSSIGIQLYDAEGHLVTINKACLDILGVTDSNQIEGVNLFEDPNIPEDIKRQLKQSESVGCEIQFDFEKVKALNFYPTGKSGAIYLNLQITPIKHNSSGETNGYLVQVQDINERKLSEEALSREKNILQVIMENSSACLVYLDPQFNFLKVNSAYAATCKTTAANLIGQNHFALYPHAENEAIFKWVKETGQPIEFHDKPFEFPDQPERGTTYWDWRLSPVKDNAGDLQGLVFSLSETTERKKAEEKLSTTKDVLEERVKQRTTELEKLNLVLNTEIVQHRQARKKISAIAASFRNLIESNADGILIMNNKGIIRFANPAAEKLLDCPNSDLIGTLFEFPLVDREQTEIDIIHRNGNVASAEMSVVITDWEGEKCFLATLRDITKRKLAEMALRKSTIQLESVFNTMVEGITLIDKNGQIIKANRAMENITGWPLSKIEGNSYCFRENRVFYPDNSPVKIEDLPVSRCLQCKEAVRGFEMGLERPDGSVVWLRVNAIPILDSENNLEGVVRTFTDITERKRMEDIIKQNEAQLRLMLDQVPIMLWVTDSSLNFTISLGAGLQAFNLKPSQLVGISLFDYYKTDDPDFYPILAHRQALTGEPATYELHWEGKILRCYVEPLRDTTDSIVGVIGISFDITDKKQAEEALRALSRRLVDVQENERREIARELHDEIGQSLTALKLMMNQSARSMDEEVPSSLLDAEVVVTELIRQVRELSLQLRPSMLDDLGLLPTLLWHIERYTVQTQVKVDFEHNGLQRYFPSAVNTAVYRIVQEALTNVARHANTKEVIVRIWADDKNISLRIEDRGCGFTPEALLSSTSTGISGMRERVLLLGGKLNIETAPGRGTCLTAELPIRENNNH